MTFRPDRFFTESQQHRLKELLARRREANIIGKPFPLDELSELTELVEAELRGATARAAAVLAGSASLTE